MAFLSKSDHAPNSDNLLLVPVLVAFIVFIAGTLLTYLLVSDQKAEDKFNLERNALQQLTAVRAHVESELSRRLNLPRSLKSFVHSNPDFTGAEFNSFANDLVRGVSGVMSLQLAPDAVVTWITNRNRNKAAIGHDLIGDPKRRPAVLRSIREKKLIVAGPVKLIQGGEAIIARLPIFIDGHESRIGIKNFWGFATVLVKTATLFERSYLVSGQDEIVIGIRGRDGLGAKGEIIFGEPRLFEHPIQTLDITLPNGSWQLVAQANPNVAAESYFTFYFLGIALTFLVCGMIWIIIRNENARRIQQVQRQAELEAERATRESEARKTAILESALSCVIMINHVGEIIEFNQAAERTFGYRRDEVIGRKMVDLIVPERLRDAHVAGMERYLKTREQKVLGKRLELPALRSDGSEFLSEIFISAIDLDESTMFAAYLQDITERKEAETELISAKDTAEAANLAKSEFLANISHEIRTPMMAISGYAELLAESEGRPRQDVEWAKRICQSSQHLGSLLQDVLDLSKIEAGRLVIEESDCDLRQLIQEVFSYFQPLASEKLLGFGVNYRSGTPENIVTDPTRIRQVLINLVSNAVKFTQKGEINIEVGVSQEEIEEHDGAAIEIAVHDTGIGVDEKQISQLFTPFTRFGPAYDAAGGTGLGLAISKRLSEMIGGRIIVSPRKGEGTTFKLVIPIKEKAESGAEQAALESTSSEGEQISDSMPPKSLEHTNALEGMRVLIVDDNEDNQAILRHMLERQGAAISSSQNGKDAIDQVKSSIADAAPYDVVLMDMRMPVMDGYEATASLRKDGIDIPIFALTAYAMEEDQKRCLDAGCNLVLSKPILSEPLVNAIVGMTSDTRTLPIGLQNNLSDWSHDQSPLSVTSKQTIQGDPQFDKIVERYRENLRNVLESLDDALASEDVETLINIVHKVKGTAGMYGFDFLSNAAEKCEILLRGGKTIDECMGCIKNVKNAVIAAVENDN